MRGEVGRARSSGAPAGRAPRRRRRADWDPDEIRADFTIDEGSYDARAAYLRSHAAEADAAREKERIRREWKAAKLADDEEIDAPSMEEGDQDDA